MKRIILVLLVSVFAFCGCNEQKTVSEKQEIVINLPKDDNVNGYRNEDYSSPTTIREDQLSDYVNAVSSYEGNKNSKVFHKVGCSFAKKMSDANKVSYKTREDFIEKGYSPCKSCNP